MVVGRLAWAIVAVTTWGCSGAEKPTAHAMVPSARVATVPSVLAPAVPSAPVATLPSAQAAQNLPDSARFLEEAQRRKVEAERVAREEEQELRRRVKEAREQQPAAPNQVAFAVGELGRWLVKQRRYGEARLLLEDALSLVADRSLESDRRAFELQLTLADLYASEGAPGLGGRPLRAAFDAAARHPSALSPQVREAAELILYKRWDPEVSKVLDHLLQVRGLAEPELQWLRSFMARRQAGEGNWDRATALVGPEQIIRRRFTPADATYSDIPAEKLQLGAPPNSRNIKNAARVVTSMRAGFRACYTAARVTTPAPDGLMRVTIRVGAEGNVTEVYGLSIGLPVSLVDCVLLRAGRATFAEPDGGSGVITLPVHFAVN